MNPNGLRVGTPAMTSRGLMEEDFVKIGQFIGSAVDVAVEVQKQSGPKIVDFKKVLKESPPGQLLELKQQVEDFASSFPTASGSTQTVAVTQGRKGRHQKKSCQRQRPEDPSDLQVLFGSASSEDRAEATCQRQQRVWALLAERWAAPEEDIIDTAATSCELDEFGELARRPAAVGTKLWIGSEADAADEHWLAQQQIQAVLNCTEEAIPRRRQEIYGRLGLEYMHLAMHDDPSENLAEAVERARPWLQRMKDQRTLVHCFVGGNRSVAVVISHLVLDQDMDFWEALETVAAARGRVLGSGSFPLQLLRLLLPGPAEADHPLLVLRQNLAPTLQLGIRMAGCNDRARFRSSSGQWSCIGQVVVMQIFMQIFLILQCYRKWGSARTPEERERYHVEGLFLALRAVDNHVLVFAVRPAVEERLGGSSCWKMKTVESRIAFSRFIFEDAEQCALQGVFLIWFESASLSDKIWIGLSTATSLSLSFTLAVQTFAEVRDWVWHRLLAVMTLNGPWILRWVMLMIMVIVYRAVACSEMMVLAAATCSNHRCRTVAIERYVCMEHSGEACTCGTSNSPATGAIQ
eukprot:s112_g28.t3